MVSVVFNTAVSYLVPIVVWIVWKRKASARTLPLIVGMVGYMFISFARAFARVVVLTDSVRADPWLFYILSALLSGVFEEVGRYVIYRYAIPNYDRRDDCISYGIGHGAIEGILTHRDVLNNDLIDSILDCGAFATGIAFHTAMSVLVFAAAHYDKKKLLAAAIGLHTIVDIIPAFYYMEKITVGELQLLHTMYVIIMCWLAYMVYRGFREPEKDS